MPNYLIDSDLDGKSFQLYLNFAPLIHCPCGSALTGSQLRESLGHGFCLGWDEAWWWWTACPEPHEVQSICISMCIHLLVLVGNNLTDMIWFWLGLVINQTSRMLPMWFDKVSWWLGPANPGKSFVDFQGHMQLHRELLPRHEWGGPPASVVTVCLLKAFVFVMSCFFTWFLIRKLKSATGTGHMPTQLLGASSLHPSMSQKCDYLFYPYIHLCICSGIEGNGHDLDPCCGIIWCPVPLPLRSTKMTLTGTTTWSWRCWSPFGPLSNMVTGCLLWEISRLVLSVST